MTSMIERVISGGQRGADQAGWRAARACGIPTGGWMPMGFRTEGRPDADDPPGPDESHPEFADLYGAKALESLEYRLRTRANVREADAVAWFGDPLTRDGRLTLALAGLVGIPTFVVKLGKGDQPIYPPARLADWLRGQAIRTLLVAGNRESRAPGIGEWVERYLGEVFRLLRTA
jgi:hypothetical protein